MSDYYSKIFPQSTYRRTESENEGREVRSVKLGLPDLSGEDAATKADISARIDAALDQVIDALGIEPRVKAADKERIRNKIANQLGIL